MREERASAGDGCNTALQAALRTSTRVLLQTKASRRITANSISFAHLPRDASFDADAGRPTARHCPARTVQLLNRCQNAAAATTRCKLEVARQDVCVYTNTRVQELWTATQMARPSPHRTQRSRSATSSWPVPSRPPSVSFASRDTDCCCAAAPVEDQQVSCTYPAW